MHECVSMLKVGGDMSIRLRVKEFVGSQVIRFLALAVILSTTACASETMQAGSRPRPASQIQTDHTYMIANGKSGHCLDLPNGSKVSGNDIQQYFCHGGPSQRWRI